jgi:hypothetical protein
MKSLLIVPSIKFLTIYQKKIVYIQLNLHKILRAFFITRLLCSIDRTNKVALKCRITGF